jgi:hypothetical protein
MKIGILADIHEDVERLELALAHLRRAGADPLITLGDICENGSRLGATIPVLAQAGVIGVWGNHDLGLCRHPTAELRARYGGPVLDYLTTLRPRLELAGCLFTHALPCWDPTDPAIYYLGPRPETDEGRHDNFQTATGWVNFLGHFHRWLAATPNGPLTWAGDRPLVLERDERYLVVVAAVCDGWCATFDTATGELTPVRLPDSTPASQT